MGCRCWPLHYHIDTVVLQLNRGKSAGDRLRIRWWALPAYVDGGLIDPREPKRICNLLKVGAVYDTRDNEPNP